MTILRLVSLTLLSLCLASVGCSSSSSGDGTGTTDPGKTSTADPGGAAVDSGREAASDPGAAAASDAGKIPQGSDEGGIGSVDLGAPGLDLGSAPIDLGPDPRDEGQPDPGQPDPGSPPVDGYDLRVADPTFEDAGMDGIWDRGERLFIGLVLYNDGTEPHMNYPGVRLVSDHPGASIDLEDNTLFGIFPEDAMDVSFGVELSEEVPAGTVITFTASVFALNCDTNPGADCPPPRPLELELEVGAALP